MKVLFFAVLIMGSALAVQASADTRDEIKVPMYFNLFGPLEWNPEHWEGQNFQPRINDYQYALPDDPRNKQGLFTNVAGLSPNDFMARLAQANIITGVYAEKSPVFRVPTGNAIIELGHNFYSLSMTDQKAIGALVKQSYESDIYLLKDHTTRKIVGTLTQSGLNLY